MTNLISSKGDAHPALPVLLDFQSANSNPPALSRWLFSLGAIIKTVRYSDIYKRHWNSEGNVAMFYNIKNIATIHPH